jgi:hypothetical protein
MPSPSLLRLQRRQLAHCCLGHFRLRFMSPDLRDTTTCTVSRAASRSGTRCRRAPALLGLNRSITTGISKVGRFCGNERVRSKVMKTQSRNCYDRAAGRPHSATSGGRLLRSRSQLIERNTKGRRTSHRSSRCLPGKSSSIIPAIIVSRP